MLRIVAGRKSIMCVKCGIRDPRLLQVHHINGDGNRDPKFYSKTCRLVRLNNLKDQQSNINLEIRCANCNISAEYEMGRRYPYLRGFDDGWNPIWFNVGELNAKDDTIRIQEKQEGTSCAIG